MKRVDLFSPEMSAKFEESLIYAKMVQVQARLVTSPQKIITVVGQGFVETTVIAQPGQYIITNPGGEEYVINGDKAALRYVHLHDNTYQSIGKIRTFRNPFCEDIEIMAPWGELQFGQADCFFAQALEGEGTDRYIIENKAFFETYAVDPGPWQRLFDL